MAFERLKRKATELIYGPKTYLPPRKRGKPQPKKRPKYSRTEALKQQLKNSGLSDKEIAKFIK